MAIQHLDKNFVQVELGDTLSSIAKESLGSPTKYKQLAAINNIINPNMTYVGQKIYLTEEAASAGSTQKPSTGTGSTGSSGTGSSSGTSSGGSTVTLGNAPTINQFGILSTDASTLFATWNWNHADTASYKVVWTYNTGNGVWLSDGVKSISVDKDAPELARQATYSIPTNAKQVRFKVKPISTTVTSENTTYNKWEANWSSVQEWSVEEKIEAPTTPSVLIEKFKLTASLENIDIDNATHIEFQLVTNNLESSYTNKKASIQTGYASTVFDIEAGNKYKVRARAYKESEDRYSEWSAYTENQGTIPSVPSGVTASALSKTSARVEWQKVGNATSYTIEYATDKSYFDSTNQTESLTVENITYGQIIGIESGETYFFRVKAINAEGDSGWSDIFGPLVIGSAPGAPTTWSSTTTAIAGEEVILYWVHNAEDGSTETLAEIELYADGVLQDIPLIENTASEEDAERARFWTLDTSAYSEGSNIKWRVRTAGITHDLGDWSTQRTIDIYAPATLTLSVTDVNGNELSTIDSFPFYIKGLAGPRTQAPIAYHVSITANESYEALNSVGNVRTISEGEEVYANHFDINTALLLVMTPAVVDLENNISYTVTCRVAMNSGLTAEASKKFRVRWTDIHFVPNARIGINSDNVTATILPYCEDLKQVYYRVELQNGKYIRTRTTVSYAWGTAIPGVRTTKDDVVYEGVNATGDEIMYCTVQESIPVTGVSLAVYRREFDGSFKLIADGLASDKSVTVVDPHPSLDFARYRIVATSDDTGAITYYDTPGRRVGAKDVIIQWNEAWSSFEVQEDETPEAPPWSGSMVRIPYNIDITEDNDIEKSLVEYAGRSHPVTYYGTHLGVSSTWSMEIPKDDKETVYSLRRLARWTGDVYVREPSGIGYWASISVSMTQTHCKMSIPVAMTVRQVEGGI